MSHYKLIFTPAKGGDGDDKTNFTLSTETASEKGNGSINKPNPDLNHSELSFVLKEVHFDRQLYAPCKLTSIITVNTAKGDFNLDAISDIFLNKTVEIRQSQDKSDDDIEIGRDYFVYNVKPGLYSTGDQIECRVELTVYSRDFWLTTIKYSRAYLSKKLGENIIKETLSSKKGLLSKYKVDFDIDNDRLRNTTYKDANSRSQELIQPYHIQYNEDFYSFISRIAIRNGDYLFFENGKFTLGLDNETAPVSLDATAGYSKVLNMSLQASSKNPVKVESYYKNYIFNRKNDKDWFKKSNEAAGKPLEIKGDKLYFNEDAFDEYFDILSLNKEDCPTTFGKQLPIGGMVIKLFTNVIPTFATIKQHTFLFGYDLLTKVGVEYSKMLVQARRNADEINDRYIKFADIKLPRDEHEKDPDAKKSKKTEYKDLPPEQRNGSLISQFATLCASEMNSAFNFMHTYYSEIRKGEEEMLEKVVTFQLSPVLCGDIKLGAKVKYGGKEYFVTRIYGNKKTDGKEDDTFIEAVPVTSRFPRRLDGGMEQMSEGVDVGLYPPYNKCYEHPLATPQVAVVADNKDPRFLNRVRVKYPWQAENELPSVWLRVQTPFSTANGGFHFQPSVGDEVMVNYEDGNVDRPFVSGFLFNAECMPSKFPRYSNREIRSENGSRIVLGTGSTASLMDDFLPVSNFVTPFLGPEMKELSKMTPGCLMGNVTLTDANGFFEISGDTAKRQVRLNSTIGKVLIDALTGVEINAQLGDVKITANNIDIEAKNRINIVSGLSIKGELDTAAKEKRKERLLGSKHGLEKAGTVAADYASSFAADMVKGKVDYSLLRGIWEAIKTPKDGTLRLKSYRYMQLEAGNGAAVDNQGFQTKQSYGDRRFVEIYNACEHVIRKTLVGRLKKFEIFAEKYNFWADAALQYNNAAKDEASIQHQRGVIDVDDRVFEFKSLIQVLKEFEDNDYVIGPASGEYCLTTDLELEAHTARSNREYELSFLTKVRDNLNIWGEKLSDSVIKLHEILEDPMNSETFAQSIHGLLKGYNGEVEDIVKTIVDCYSETRSQIEYFSDYSQLLPAVSRKRNLHGELADFLKYWFRNIVYTLLQVDVFHISSSHLHKLEGSSKAKIISLDWLGIIDSLDTEEENSKLYDDITQREGTDVSKDQWNGVSDFYHRQLKSPSSIWSDKQEGRILISDSVGKTMRLNKDRTDWEVQDNKFTIAVVSRFLKTK